jgi:hypothetical protein
MDPITIIMSAFITIFSLGLLTISLASYRKHKNTKLIFVSVVFLIFFIKGVILSLSLFIDPLGVFQSVIPIGLFDVIILMLLFLATLKR